MAIAIIGEQPSARLLKGILHDKVTPKDVAVCWGAQSIKSTEGSIVLNGVSRRDARQQLTMLEKAGLVVPLWTDDLVSAKEWVRQGMQVWGRRWNHTQGSDIIGPGYRPTRTGRYGRVRPEGWNQTWCRREWWVQVVPEDHIVAEWRIHVFQGRIITRGQKVQTGEPSRIQLVRSRSNGWTLDSVPEPPNSVRQAARQAVQAVGYNFGAVDILDTKDGPVVLEVNSAPALRSPSTLDAYVQAILKCANGKYSKWHQPDGEK